LVPLNAVRCQNLVAARPRGRPSVVTARLECRRSPHTVWVTCRPLTNDRRPIPAGVPRVKLNSVVSCSTSTAPAVAANRAAVAATCPARRVPPPIRGLLKNR
jgi:hypothetical protein